ncbi:GH1 family beta-glucosidase [Paradesertivirga mongoliensis]|uniref:Beta-glucosidase n=1 Tax=Paradesertivirga mongoliensis TaxID=2100740 RepID=A0ABW4ZHE0_9SPHI
MQMNREDFGSDFEWGVSTAAYQIEGSHDVDGKGLSIWDVFTSKKGKVRNNHHGNTACDFYNCFKGDIGLIKDLNIPNFRFSISWSRIIPNGQGAVNQNGIDYYNRIIDYSLECGITPWLTLYHWDLPQALELRGGWTNRDIIGWFSDYTELCAKNFGDRVNNWMVMNEPSVFTGAGYFLGIHAPGRSGLRNFLPAIHHVTLATSSAARQLKAIIPHANLGTTFSCTHIEPQAVTERNLLAVNRVDTLLNRTFLEPILGMGYPQNDLKVLRKLDKYIKGNDEADMAFDFDFIGFQNYTREIVKASFFTPYLGASLVKAEKRNVPLTDMKWEVYPQAMYHVIKKFDAYPQIRKIIITENGAAFPDIVVNGEVADEQRISYLKDNLQSILRAKKEGCKVDGYFVWTLTDNFEWAEGYHPRFGLIYVDFDTQRRIVKDSGKWYKEFLTRKA